MLYLARAPAVIVRWRLHHKRDMALTTDGDIAMAAAVRPGAAIRWRWWLGILGLWTAAGILTAHYWYARASFEANPPPLSLIYRLAMQGAWQWALFTPIVVWLARTVPIDRPAWGARIAFHVAAAAAFALLDPALDRLAFPLLTGLEAAPYSGVLIGQVQTNVFNYLLVLATAHGVEYYRRMRERQVEAVQLEAQLSRAQLQMLKTQLQPHFLFNTLSAISELVHRDPHEADRMVTRLGDLLRMTMQNAGTQMVALRQEIDFLVPYLEIERMRFAGRLRVTFDIAPETLDARVPNLVLQPIVENALRHGIAPRAAGGEVVISSRLVGGTLLELAVADDGRGLPAGGESLALGIGLRNTKERLAQLYGAHHRLEIENRPEGGVMVTVRLPHVADPELQTGEFRTIAASRSQPMISGR